MSKLYASITGCSNITDVRVSASHSNNTATAVIKCGTTTLDVGSYITVDLGYTTNHSVVFTGYVKELNRDAEEYQVVAYDKMIRAVDYFLVSEQPDTPYKYSNIPAEELVGELYEFAGLTDYGYSATSFTFGINHDVEINLTSIYDYVHSICSLLAYHTYCDLTGKVWFVRRLPFLVTSEYSSIAPIDTVNKTIYGNTTDYIIEESRTLTEANLRNKVVVWGSDNVGATASAVSPYLPAGFYKTMLFSNQILVQDTSMAQSIADFNLKLLNKLDDSLRLVIVGRPDIACRDIVKVYESKLGLNNTDWYAFTVEHYLASTGYLTTLELRR